MSGGRVATVGKPPPGADSPKRYSRPRTASAPTSVFECTGVAGLLQPAAALVRRGGTLSLLGYPITDSSVSYGDWQSRELRVVGSLAYNHDDFLGAMRALATGAVDVAPLITGTVGLDGLAAVLTDMGSGKTTHAKVLVDPER